MRLMLESLNVKGHHEVKSSTSYCPLHANPPLDSNVIKESSDSRTVLSDEALMAAYANGNMQAFETLYARHKDPLLRYFIRQVSNRANAEELFQEAWQSLIKNSKSYKSSAKFTTYLYTIAHSRLVDFYRKNGREDWLTFVDEGEEGVSTEETQPEVNVCNDELKLKLLDSLDALPLAQKEVFLLKFEAGMSVPEIAESLGENPEAVKSRLRYCIANLKGYFHADELKG